MGSSAYHRFSKFLHRQGFQDSLFDELSDRFGDLGLVIGDLHLVDITDKRLIELLDKYQTTGSERYRTLLQAKGIMFLNGNYDV